jgi:exoribonuclease-2
MDGKIVDIFEDNRVKCGFSIEDKGNRLRVVTERGRILSIPKSRIFCVSHATFDPGIPVEKKRAILEEENQLRESLASKINTGDVWEVLVGEKESVDIDEVTGLVYGEVTDSGRSAIFRSCWNDKIHFKLKGNTLLVNDREKAAKLLAKERKEADRRRQLDDIRHYLQSLIRSEPPSTLNARDMKSVAEWLRDVVLHGKHSSYYRTVKEILSGIGLSMQDGPFELLVQMGEWKKDENIHLHKYNIPVSWSEGAMKECSDLLRTSDRTVEEAFHKRRDLRRLRTFTIDHPSTRDFDDAISVEDLDGKRYRIGMHIAEVSTFLAQYILLEKEAAERGTSIYMPDQLIPMFPSSLSEGIFSLQPGKVRLALSTLVTVNENLEIDDFEIVPSVVELAVRYTYDEVDSLIEEGKKTDRSLEFAYLFEFARHLREQRKADGASIVQDTELSIHVDSEGNIHVEKQERNNPAQILVSEMMILTNRRHASFFVQNDLPAIYRCQPEPSGELVSTDVYDPIVSYRNRKLRNRPYLSVIPSRHAGLGIDAYLTITSPIRRYIDLVMQRQIEVFLERGIPRYSGKALEDIINYSDINLSNAALVSMARERYWLFRYLETKRGEEVRGIVLDVMNSRCIVQLTEYLLEVEMRIRPGLRLHAGEEHILRIDRVNSRHHTILLSFVR